jgi:hypothetical protein
MEARIRSLSLKCHCQGHSQSAEIVRAPLPDRRRFLGRGCRVRSMEIAPDTSISPQDPSSQILIESLS